jgi:hypothetical protein
METVIDYGGHRSGHLPQRWTDINYPGSIKAGCHLRLVAAHPPSDKESTFGTYGIIRIRTRHHARQVRLAMAASFLLFETGRSAGYDPNKEDATVAMVPPSLLPRLVFGLTILGRHHHSMTCEAGTAGNGWVVPSVQGMLGHNRIGKARLLLWRVQSTFTLCIGAINIGEERAGHTRAGRGARKMPQFSKETLIVFSRIEPVFAVPLCPSLLYRKSSP